jgi:GNAT superfamily N-acetyltransferase
MCDEWMPTLRLPLTWEQFARLPRNPAYKYEYLDGQAVLSPRTRFYHARLDLAAHARRGAPDLPDGLALRPARAEGLASLAGLFAAAFDRLQPFGSLDEAGQLRAAQGCLERTRTGGDGPWVEAAGFTAEDRGGNAVGACLITLLPQGDPRDYETYYWREPPPPDCVARRLGQPHLTWIFVAPLAAGEGLGTALLAASARALRRLGFGHLLSTFLLGNESSMLWHWRNGFELLAYPGSFRRLRTRGRTTR